MARSRVLAELQDFNKQEIPETVERRFLEDLKSSIKITDTKNSRMPSKTYKPSSLHCIRNMYYQVIGYEPVSNSSSELIGICESGTDRHDRIQKAIIQMKENGIDCEYVDVGKFVKSRDLSDIDVVSQQGNETKLFNKRLNMSFLCDGIIKYNNKYYILEIKTEKSNKFWGREGVNPDHILQGTAYSLNLGIDDVIFLYECRDDCNKKAFMLHVTDEMRENLSDKIMSCNEFVEKNIAPPKPKTRNKTYCSYCDYKDRCSKDG